MSEPVQADLIERVCPECGETIKAAAKKCRFCGTFFDTAAQRKQRMGAKKQPKGDASTGLLFAGIGLTAATFFGAFVMPSSGIGWLFALPLGPLLVIAGVVAHFRERDSQDAEW